MDGTCMSLQSGIYAMHIYVIFHSSRYMGLAHKPEHSSMSGIHFYVEFNSILLWPLANQC